MRHTAEGLHVVSHSLATYNLKSLNFMCSTGQNVLTAININAHSNSRAQNCCFGEICFLDRGVK